MEKKKEKTSTLSSIKTEYNGYGANRKEHWKKKNSENII